MMNEAIGLPIQVFGEVCLRKHRRKRQKMLLKQLFEDYCRNTTLHGLRYITENGLHVAEKLFWLLTFAVSVALSFYLISKVWNKWTTSPVIVSFAGKPVFVNEVPFPAVTICPAVKFKQSEFNFTKALIDRTNLTNQIDNETLATAKAINLICDYPNMKYVDINSNSSDIERLLNVTVSYGDIFGWSKIGGKYVHHKSLFGKVLTDDGVCFTFNGLAPQHILNVENIQKEYNYSHITKDIRNWTLAAGYNSKNDDSYPHRGQESSESPYLTLLMIDLEKYKDKMCNAVSTGYKIYLHHPSEWPQASSYYFASLPEQLSSMAVKLTMVTSDDLQSVALHVRQCYFLHEKPLKYFKIYTYNHCRLECLTNYTYYKCGCVLFHMPFHDSTNICSSIKSLRCAMSANDKLASIGSQKQKCNCLPACNYIQYDAEIHKTDYKFDDYIHAKSQVNDFHHERGSSTFGKVEIFFKEPMFMTVHRSELFGVTDFLGICGGLLGLFLGFSFLSIVEIFYFITFRVFKTIKSDLNNEKMEKLAVVLGADLHHERHI